MACTRMWLCVAATGRLEFPLQEPLTLLSETGSLLGHLGGRQRLVGQ